MIPIGVEIAIETGHETGGRLQKSYLHPVTWIIMARLEEIILQVVVVRLLIFEAEDLLLMVVAALLLETLACMAQRVETFDHQEVHRLTTMENLATGTTLMSIDVESAVLLVGVEAETADESRLE